MKDIFKIGDKKFYRKVVDEHDVARFHGEVVHRVYSTFAMARDAEWTTRQFVLEMRDADEEGVGTSIAIEHSGPAFVGEEVIFTGVVKSIRDTVLMCSFEARVGQRLIATGETGQKILKREKIKNLFNKDEQTEIRR